MLLKSDLSQIRVCRRWTEKWCLGCPWFEKWRRSLVDGYWWVIRKAAGWKQFENCHTENIYPRCWKYLLVSIGRLIFSKPFLTSAQLNITEQSECYLEFMLIATSSVFEVSLFALKKCYKSFSGRAHVVVHIFELDNTQYDEAIMWMNVAKITKQKKTENKNWSTTWYNWILMAFRSGQKSTGEEKNYHSPVERNWRMIFFCCSCHVNFLTFTRVLCT